jgi:hypothetical protein
MEKVVRHSITTEENARPMTQRELNAEHEKREKAVDMDSRRLDERPSHDEKTSKQADQQACL